MNDEYISPDVSIIILTYNKIRMLEMSLSAIFSQRSNLTYEVIIIDSSSTDGIEKLTSGFNVKLVRIDKKEFHHSKTRNLGVSLSKGRYVVFLTGDAIPHNSSWLANLVMPLEKNRELFSY